MGDPTESLKLYELLTQEIQSAETQTYQLVSVGTGAIAAILAAGFNQLDPTLRLFIFLVSYLIIFPMVRLLEGNRSRIWRIATYMRTFLEPGLPGVQWQTQLAALGRSSTFIIWSQMLVVQLATAVVGVVTFITLCVLAKWSVTSFVPSSATFDHVAASAAAIAASANVSLIWYEISVEQKSRRGGPIEQHWLRSWEALSKRPAS